jgi:hypothetical protein
MTRRTFEMLTDMAAHSTEVALFLCSDNEHGELSLCNTASFIYELTKENRQETMRLAVFVHL